MSDFRPDDFIPRGPDRRWAGVLHVMLMLLIIGAWWKPGCDRFTGIVARLDKRRLPRKRVGQGVNSGVAHGVDNRYGAIWLEETGDMMVGYAMSSKLHDTRVGDRVTLWVRPDTGSVEGLKNLTRPRKWWTR